MSLPIIKLESREEMENQLRLNASSTQANGVLNQSAVSQISSAQALQYSLLWDQLTSDEKLLFIRPNRHAIEQVVIQRQQQEAYEPQMIALRPELRPQVIQQPGLTTLFLSHQRLDQQLDQPGVQPYRLLPPSPFRQPPQQSLQQHVQQLPDQFQQLPQILPLHQRPQQRPQYRPQYPVTQSNPRRPLQEVTQINAPIEVRRPVQRDINQQTLQ